MTFRRVGMQCYLPTELASNLAIRYHHLSTGSVPSSPSSSGYLVISSGTVVFSGLPAHPAHCLFCCQELPPAVAAFKAKAADLKAQAGDSKVAHVPVEQLQSIATKADEMLQWLSTEVCMALPVK